MTETPLEWAARKRQEARERNQSNACWECWGGFYTPSGFVPHASDCRRALGRRPQSRGEQDREREAFTDRPRYGMLRWPEHGWSW